MKTVKKNIPSLFFIFLFFAFLPLTITANPIEAEEVEIINCSQVVEFYIDKQTNSLHAKLTVQQKFKSNSTIPVKVRQVVSFDNTSSVKKNWAMDAKKKRSIPSIIMDYESDGIFHNDLKLAIVERTIPTKGETLVLGYEKIFSDTRFLTSLYFQQTHSVQSSTIKVVVPFWLRLRVEELNFDQVGLTEKKEKGAMVYNYNQNNIKKPAAEKNAPSRQKTAPHLIFVVNAYTNNGKEIVLTESVEDLYSWYASLVNQIGNESAVLEDLVANLLEGQTSDEEKIKAIYYWVQDNIRYIAFEDGINGFRPESCQSVYNNKYGDCKGMANLVKEMLLIAGYDARLTWIGTREIPYSYDIPSLLVDNHMICAVLLNGEKLFLDPTQKFIGIEEYSYNIQEQEVLIENGDSFIRDIIPLSNEGHYFIETKEFLRIDGETLVGKGTSILGGSARIALANYLSSIREDKRKAYIVDHLAGNSKNVTITLEELPDWTKRDVGLPLSYQINLDNQITDIGKEIYLNLEKDFYFLNATISADRKNALEFSDILLVQSTIEISIPADSQVEYLPEPVTIQHEKYDFELSYLQKGNKVFYNKKIALKNTIIEEPDFKSWNTAIASIKSFYEDQIIIKKATE